MLFISALLLVGAVAVPKLFWNLDEVAMTCPDYEHAIDYLEDVMTDARDRSSFGCVPGRPECIAEGWMYSEALSLRVFLSNAYGIACQKI